MANQLYTGARQQYLTGGLNWSTDNLRAALISSAYVVNTTGNNFLPDIPSYCIVASSTILTNQLAVSGQAFAGNVTLPNVSGVNTIPYVLVFKDTNTYTTCRLICHIDNASGLPVTSNGGNIGINFDQVSGIFTL